MYEWQNAYYDSPKCELLYERIVETTTPRLSLADTAKISTTPRPPKRRRPADSEDRDEPAQFRRVRLRYWSPDQNSNAGPTGDVPSSIAGATSASNLTHAPTTQSRGSHTREPRPELRKFLRRNALDLSTLPSPSFEGIPFPSTINDYATYESGTKSFNPFDHQPSIGYPRDSYRYPRSPISAQRSDQVLVPLLSQELTSQHPLSLSSKATSDMYNNSFIEFIYGRRLRAKSSRDPVRSGGVFDDSNYAYFGHT